MTSLEVIRLLEEHEIGVYRDIRSEALTTDPDAFGETLEVFESRGAATLRQWFHNQVEPGDRGILIAELEGRVVAMCGFGSREEDAAEGFFWGMFVSPSARRRGIGAALLARAEALLRAGGATRIRAKVAAPNEGAIEFYRAAGFTIDGRAGTLREGSDVPVYEVEKAVEGA